MLPPANYPRAPRYSFGPARMVFLFGDFLRIFKPGIAVPVTCLTLFSLLYSNRYLAGYVVVLLILSTYPDIPGSAGELILTELFQNLEYLAIFESSGTNQP
jgi:hypothetical protein